MKRFVTDGGRSAFGFDNEDNDCAVIALSYVMEITYKEAHTKLDSAGRSYREGFHIIEFLEHCTFKGYNIAKSLKYKKGSRPTEEEFALEHKRGNWLVYTKGHLIAVINGVIYDNRKHPSANKVQYAWRFEKIS